LRFENMKIKIYCPDCGNPIKFNFTNIRREERLQCPSCDVNLIVNYSTPMRIIKILPE